MIETTSSVLQILGHQCLTALVATFQIPEVRVLDPPFVGLVLLGSLASLSVLTGLMADRKHAATETADSIMSVRTMGVFLLAGLLPLGVARGEEEKEATARRTMFFQQFDSRGFPDKYDDYFTKVTKKNARNNLTFFMPTSERFDVFKDFKIVGTIDADQLDRLLIALEIELKAAVEKAGATSDVELKTKIADRPIYLLAYIFSDGVSCRELSGFCLSYTEGPVVGEIDVFVRRQRVGEQMEITVACAVHEAERSAGPNQD